MARFETKDGTGVTSREGVYAGGDIVTGSATVILAMGAGRQAAQADSDDPVDGRKDKNDSGAFGAGKYAAEAEDHAPFVFPQDFNGIQNIKNDQTEDNDRIGNHRNLLFETA